MSKPKLTVFVILVLALLAGCAGMQQPTNPQETYLIALTQYSNLQDLYLRNEAKITDPEVKAKLKDAFNKSALALELWGVALDAGKPTIQGEISYDQAMDILIEILPTVIEIVGVDE
jgi:hypothetical protein